MRLQAVPDPDRTALVHARVSTKEQAHGGGDGDGYSLPAQRDACRRKAQSLNATVLDEFIDKGESARTADRPELQRLLSYLAREHVDYVIVHKIDRLARNRADDVAVTAAIAASGAKLVSVTENIDETPSGLLLHGIMSSIAEFYSRNLANEVIKGAQQKVQAGGTPTRAPSAERRSATATSRSWSTVTSIERSRSTQSEPSTSLGHSRPMPRATGHCRLWPPPSRGED